MGYILADRGENWSLQPFLRRQSTSRAKGAGARRHHDLFQAGIGVPDICSMAASVMVLWSIARMGTILLGL
jgi:hypothetical protein